MKITIANQHKQTKVTGIESLTPGVWRTTDDSNYVLMVESKPKQIDGGIWHGCILFQDKEPLFSYVIQLAYWRKAEFVKMSDDFELKLSE